MQLRELNYYFTTKFCQNKKIWVKFKRKVTYIFSLINGKHLITRFSTFHRKKVDAKVSLRNEQFSILELLNIFSLSSKTGWSFTQNLPRIVQNLSHRSSFNPLKGDGEFAKSIGFLIKWSKGVVALWKEGFKM